MIKAKMGPLTSGSINPMSAAIDFSQDVEGIGYAAAVGQQAEGRGYPFLNAIKQDVEVDTAIASDKILLQALNNPTDFINLRDDIIEGIALESAKASVNITKYIVNGFELPNTTANDLARKLGGSILSLSIKEVEAIFGPLKERVVNKLSTTRTIN